jgi:hypothetical protein
MIIAQRHLSNAVLSVSSMPEHDRGSLQALCMDTGQARKGGRNLGQKSRWQELL